ncbi:16S rRNA (cytidine(1402)-2'-O)-methyltransferase [Candidatus Gracilibacteria bacterium]|nr:16S rRNA (cytidine(1402)-2'-O)-methyltransferase [Candidatus Gracilibacteria bacterium]MCF7819777.1 16S rRNA (cytidine(1402)-2'-O)-methyltransferase [Candidatus Gracilibacteria bacterium]
MKKLYMVATPIGNLGDMTLRAIEILKSVDVVITEDTRHTKILLEKYKIDRPMTSFHAKTSPEKLQRLINKIQSGSAAAYVSDAGTPCVSDPGYRLIRAALEEGIEVLPLPGPSALTALLSVAGVPADSFCFHGFLPHKKGRQTLLKSFQDEKISHIFYESVHRFSRLLTELSEYLQKDRIIVIGRELTKIHEEVFRGTVLEAQKHFTAENTKGEFVVLIAPKNFV